MGSRTASGELTEIRETLRGVGLRATTARVAVLRVLRAAETPLSHAEVADQVESTGVNRATVFRNLTDLTEHRLARRLEVGGRVWRFEAVDDPSDEEGHSHYTCTVCGQVACVHDPVLEAATRRLAHSIGTVDEVLLKGVCQQCAPCES